MDGAIGLEELALLLPELQETIKAMRGANRSNDFRSEDHGRFSRTDSLRVCGMQVLDAYKGEEGG